MGMGITTVEPGSSVGVARVQPEEKATDSSLVFLSENNPVRKVIAIEADHLGIWFLSIFGMSKEGKERKALGLINDIVRVVKTTIPGGLDSVQKLKMVHNIIENTFNIKSGKETLLTSGLLQDPPTVSPTARAIIYLAIGHELRWPVKLASVPGYTFIRWHNIDGTYSNWETNKKPDSFVQNSAIKGAKSMNLGLYSIEAGNPHQIRVIDHNTRELEFITRFNTAIATLRTSRESSLYEQGEALRILRGITTDSEYCKYRSLFRFGEINALEEGLRTLSMNNALGIDCLINPRLGIPKIEGPLKEDTTLALSPEKVAENNIPTGKFQRVEEQQAEAVTETPSPLFPTREASPDPVSDKLQPQTEPTAKPVKRVPLPDCKPLKVKALKVIPSTKKALSSLNKAIATFKHECGVKNPQVAAENLEKAIIGAKYADIAIVFAKSNLAKAFDKPVEKKLFLNIVDALLMRLITKNRVKHPLNILRAIRPLYVADKSLQDNFSTFLDAVTITLNKTNSKVISKEQRNVYQQKIASLRFK